jgi:hypothetical protein
MALVLRNLSPVNPAARGSAPVMWTYMTDDAHAAVDSAGYFNNASTLLGIGDIINVVVVDDPAAVTSVSTYGTHVVLSNAAGVVDVSDVTVGVVTDTD